MDKNEPQDPGFRRYENNRVEIDSDTRTSLIQINLAVIAGVIAALNLNAEPSWPALIFGVLNIATVTLVEMSRILFHGFPTLESDFETKLQISASTISLNAIGLLFIGGSFFIGAYPEGEIGIGFDLAKALIYTVLILSTIIILLYRRKALKKRLSGSIRSGLTRSLVGNVYNWLPPWLQKYLAVMYRKLPSRVQKHIRPDLDPMTMKNAPTVPEIIFVCSIFSLIIYFT